MVTICHSNWHGAALSDLQILIYAGHPLVSCAGLFLTKIPDEDTNIDALHVAETVTRGWLSSALGLAVCRGVNAALKILVSYVEIPYCYLISPVSDHITSARKAYTVYLLLLVHNHKARETTLLCTLFRILPASISILSALSCPAVPLCPRWLARWTDIFTAHSSGRPDEPVCSK